jgi:hypothetical protein
MTKSKPFIILFSVCVFEAFFPLAATKPTRPRAVSSPDGVTTGEGFDMTAWSFVWLC